MLNKRVEVLFEPKQYETLEERARIEGRSVGALIREAVTKYVVRPTDEERRKAAQWFASQTWDDVGDWAEEKEKIIQARVEAIERSLETR